MRTDEGRIANARAVSASIPLEVLSAVLTVHRVNCSQPGCPVLVALEERVVPLGTPGAPRGEPPRNAPHGVTRGAA